MSSFSDLRARWAWRSRMALLHAIALACGLAACGGGGGGSGSDVPPPAVVSVRFVGPGGGETDAISPRFVPRNAWVEIVFSAPIDPATAIDPNVRIRSGPHFQIPSQGMFHLDGARLLFDPTVTTGDPRPLGFDPSADYEIRIPSGVPTGQMLRGANGKAILTTFVSTFKTTDGWVTDNVPPRLVSHRFEPGAVGGSVSPNAALVLEFSETIAPGSLSSCIGATPGPYDGVDVRYRASGAVNVAAGVAGSPVLVRLSQPTSTSIRVEPAVSWGEGPFAFDVSVLPGLRDLAGNQLSPSTTVGPFASMGGGAPTPRRILGEAFESSADRDAIVSDAPWGPTTVAGTPLTTRRVRILSANSALLSKTMGLALGQAVVYPAPMIGADLNNFAVVTPATRDGRRVMLSFDSTEMGPSGSITSAAWGPDRNATFGATYPQTVLRMGYGTPGNVAVKSTFSSSYTSAPVEVYRGPYSVAQRLNVGNEVPALINTTGDPTLQRLFDFTGFVEWPRFTTTFEWAPTTPDGHPQTLLFDLGAAEGNTWQDQRAYFPFPLVVGVAAGGVAMLGQIAAAFPPRRLSSRFEADTADPIPNAVTANPDSSVTDTAFTIANRRVVAQSAFYTPPAIDPAGVAYAGPYSAATTLGTRSNYDAALVLTSALPGGASYRIEFQGAFGVADGSARRAPDLTKPMTAWTTNIDECDRYPFFRWRLTLFTDLVNGGVPIVDAVVIPVRDSGP